jgi:hypothetical protein
MLESDLPKQAAQASKLAGDASHATITAQANNLIFFISNQCA